MTKIPASCANLEVHKARRALIKNHGNVSAAAKELGVPIQDFRIAAVANPQLLAAALEVEAQALDEAEAVIRRALRESDASKRIAAAGVILRSAAGKRRGFG
jgi:hypothetical protein